MGKLTPNVIWTQIYSYIKGSASAHLYPGWYMSYPAYINAIGISDKSRLLSKEDRIEIYNIFGAYERWKLK